MPAEQTANAKKLNIGLIIEPEIFFGLLETGYRLSNNTILIN